jgi:hypothetical protein
VNTRTGDNLPGGVYNPGAGTTGEDFGPLPMFKGLYLGATTDPKYGYLDYENDGQGGVRTKHTTVASGTVAGDPRPSSVFKGQNVYEVRLTQSVLGSQDNRYAQYTAQLLTGNAVRGEFRILGHDANKLYLAQENELSADDRLPSGVTNVKVLDKFFHVFTGTVEGFSKTYQSGGNQQNPILAPTSNVQIGFAFHKNPADPDLTTVAGQDQNREPKELGTFLYDLSIGDLRNKHLRYVQWHLLFNTRFQANGPSSPFQNEDSLGPQTQRPALSELRLLFRY